MDWLYFLGKQQIFGNEIEMKESNFKSVAFLIFAFSFLCLINGAIMGSNCEVTPCCDDNTINVNGVGKVSVQPDIAYITVGVTVTAKTSQAATQSVADKISQIIQILTSFNIPKTDIKTQSINIYPQYNYPNGLQTLIGQTASQTLIATVRNIDKNGGDLGKIIDQLVKVDEIQFNSLTFDKEDKSTALKQARRLAFIDAKTKALDLASLSERVLGKVLTILDSTSEPSPTPSAAPIFTAKANVATQVPVGDLDIYYYLNIKFALN